MQTPEQLDLRTAGLLLRNKAPKKEDINGRGAVKVLAKQIKEQRLDGEVTETLVFQDLTTVFKELRSINSLTSTEIDSLQARTIGRLGAYLGENYPLERKLELEEFAGFLSFASRSHLWRDEPEYARDLAKIYLQVFPPKDKTS